MISIGPQKKPPKRTKSWIFFQFFRQVLQLPPKPPSLPLALSPGHISLYHTAFKPESRPFFHLTNSHSPAQHTFRGISPPSFPPFSVLSPPPWYGVDCGQFYQWCQSRWRTPGPVGAMLLPLSLFKSRSPLPSPLPPLHPTTPHTPHPNPHPLSNPTTSILTIIVFTNNQIWTNHLPIDLPTFKTPPATHPYPHTPLNPQPSPHTESLQRTQLQLIFNYIPNISTFNPPITHPTPFWCPHSVFQSLRTPQQILFY